ncbi:MAG: hypothetical protein E6767_03100 [Dysgonomonas sp.]|nr:hypothetical protein [Dysgonomonas sp.]
MKKKMIIEIETTCDLELSAQRVECHITNDKGRIRAEDEVCLMISGYDPGKDQEVEEIVTISKAEAKRLSSILLDLVAD